MLWGKLGEGYFLVFVISFWSLELILLKTLGQWFKILFSPSVQLPKSLLEKFRSFSTCVKPGNRMFIELDMVAQTHTSSTPCVGKGRLGVQGSAAQ